MASQKVVDSNQPNSATKNLVQNHGTGSLQNSALPNAQKDGASKESQIPGKDQDSKVKESPPSSNLSDYILLPKAQAVQSYAKSVYAWICGSKQTASSSAANVTLAAPHQKLSRNVVAPNKVMTSDGEPLSGINPSAESSTTSNNTTDIPFSDLSSTASDQTLIKNNNSSGKTAKEKEEDSWANLQDIKSSNDTTILSTKSDTSLNLGEKTVKKSDGNGAEDDMQFSFMKQLGELEHEKTKDFLVPDQLYFGDRDKAAQNPVHKPLSQATVPSKAATSPSSTLPVTDVKNFLTSLIPHHQKPQTNDNRQKE